MVEEDVGGGEGGVPTETDLHDGREPSEGEAAAGAEGGGGPSIA